MQNFQSTIFLEFELHQRNSLIRAFRLLAYALGNLDKPSGHSRNEFQTTVLDCSRIVPAALSDCRALVHHQT